MGATDEGVDLMFEGIVAVFIEPGVQPRRLQIWKQKFQQRGGVIKEHIKGTVTHIFAIGVKFLEDRVGQGHLRKLRATLLKYEWLEDCLKAGHSVAPDPYLLLHDSKAQNSDESQPSSTVSDSDLGSLFPSSMTLMHSPQAQEKGEQSDERSIKRSKIADDWMSVIHKGANAGALGKRGKSVTHAYGASNADSRSELLDFTSQAQSQPMEETEGTYSPPNKNKNITDIFGELRNIYGDALGEKTRAFSYRKAILVLEKLPERITSVDDLKGLPSIGTSLREQIGEILSTGTLVRLENFKKDEKVSAISQFAAVWGIGPTTAEKLYVKGHRSLNDLMSDESLSAAQKLGLRFHDDINKKIPRHEVKEMKTLVRQVAESIEKNVIVVCGGSYRRGKDLVGDMDMVITHPDGKSHVGFLRKLHQKLKEIDFLTEDLQLRLDHGPLETEKAVDTYFGLCKYPGREQRHRIDVKVYPYEKYPFGLIAWTGNDVLNRRLRMLAASKCFKLDDQGCFPVMKDADGNEVLRSFASSFRFVPINSLLYRWSPTEAAVSRANLNGRSSTCSDFHG